LAISPAGELFAFHGGSLWVANLDSGLTCRLDIGAVEGHGITLTSDDTGGESLWIADPGRTSRVSDDPGVEDGIEVIRGEPRVFRVSTSGELLDTLPNPAEGAEYAPTSVAVSEGSLGGDGSIWVADGYGSSLVHRFDEAGNHIDTFGGTDDNGRLATPHALLMDYRRDRPELLIADRGNRRVVVLDAISGTVLREAGQSFLTSPSGFAIWQEEYLVIAELRARLTVVDRDFKLVDYLGANPGVAEMEGWPNEVANGRKVRTSRLRPGSFNSPHAVAVRGDELIVSEWLIGGRYTVLRP
jgi:hypothetical protein